MRTLLTLAVLTFLALLAAGPARAQPAREDIHLHDFEADYAYTQAVRLGDRLIVSGTVSVDAQGRLIGRGDMRAQIRQIYATLSRLLAAQGADLSHVVKETVYTTQMKRFLAAADERARAYRAVPAPRLPASSWIGVAHLVAPEHWVEIEIEALLPPAPSHAKAGAANMQPPCPCNDAN